MKQNTGKQEMKEKILSAATELFASNGFHETSTRLIAERAKISEPTLFKYFPKKNCLLQAIFQEGWEHFLEVTEKVVTSTENVFERLRRILDGCVTYLLANPGILQVMLTEERQNNKKLQEAVIPPAKVRFLDILENLFKQGQVKGIFSQDCRNPRLLIYSAVGIVETLLELLGPADSGKRVSLVCNVAEIQDVCYRFMASFVLPASVVEDVVYNNEKLCLSSSQQDLERSIMEIKTTLEEVLMRSRPLPEAQGPGAK